MRIEQTQSYRGNDWWNWSVWLDGPDAEMDSVEHVTWHLHPSFVPGSVRRGDRAGKFRLDTSGWGTFTVRAELQLRDGRTQVLKHELELFYPDTSSPTA